MAEFPALPLWTDAYLADTLDLTLEEHGFYLLILMLAWRRPDCAIPNDMPWLKRSLSACCAGGIHGHTFNAHVPKMLRRFFHLSEDGKWHQKRLDKERSYLRERSKKNRQTALKRWSKESQTEFKIDSKVPQTNCSGEEFQSVIECEGNTPTPTPTPIRKKELPSEARKKAVAPPAASPTDKRGERLSDDWEPNADDRAYAADRGLSEAEIDAAAVEFRNFWTALPGQRSRKLDWSKTWRNRVMEVSDRKVRRNGNGRQPYVSPQAQLTTQLMHEMAEELANGGKGSSRRDEREPNREVTGIRDRSRR